MIAWNNLTGTMDGWDWGFFWFGQLWFTAVMTIYLLLFLLLGRQKIQQSAYDSFLQHVAQEEPQKRHRKRLSDLPTSTVSHVVCATELTSGQPFYMSRDMVLSPLYGRGDPDLSLAKAIYASAAFPIGFPPLRLRARDLDLSGGQDDEAPDTLMLSDGGVFVVEAAVPDLEGLAAGQEVVCRSVRSGVVELKAATYDRVQQTMASQRVTVDGAGVELRPFAARYAWPSELDLMARLAGLELRNRWGGWDRRPFTSASRTHVSVYARPTDPPASVP
jgi:predicted acylesterase/phospholipase RssA